MILYCVGASVYMDKPDELVWLGDEELGTFLSKEEANVAGEMAKKALAAIDPTLDCDVTIFEHEIKIGPMLGSIEEMTERFKLMLKYAEVNKVP